MFVFFEVQSLIFRSWDDCDISVIHSVLGVQQMSYSWISATMEREHGMFGRRTLIICRWRWSLLIGKETWNQHRLCVDRATNLCMVVSGHGHMRRGLVVNQATTQRRWLVMASFYDSQGYIVRCGCVLAYEEGISTVSESGIREVQWRHHRVTLQDLQWTVTRMRWRPVRRCVCDFYDAKRCSEPLENITNSY